MNIWLNGEIIPLENAKISILDHGFLYGHGIFETIRYSDNQLKLIDEHLERLKASASFLHIPFNLTLNEIKQAIEALICSNQLKNAYIRITLSKGQGPMGIKGTFAHPTLAIFAKDLVLPSSQDYEQGRHVCILKTKRSSPETGIRLKSLNYLNSLMGSWELQERKAAEGIMLNDKEEITEGTVANLFFVEKDLLITPSLETGILNGITRQHVIKLAKEMGIPVIEQAFGIEKLSSFHEAFTTNAIAEIVPIKSIEKQLLNAPGPLTKKLMEKFSYAIR